MSAFVTVDWMMISLLADGASTAFPAESTISTSPAGTCSVLAILAPTFAVCVSTIAVPASPSVSVCVIVTVSPIDAVTSELTGTPCEDGISSA